MKYPEIFDFSDLEVWKNKYLRKELLSYEWDMMVNEVALDVFEIPFFTQEFCDKLVENLKDENFEQIGRWGTDVDTIHAKQISFDETLTNIIHEYVYSICQHEWHVEGRKWQVMDADNLFMRLKEGQDIRLHHDFVSISLFLKLDDESEGGELFFPKYNFTLSPKPGHMYIYPGQITHRYGIKRISKGDTYFLMSYCISR